MRKPWVDTDPPVIVVKEYTRKIVKLIVFVGLLYLVSYAIGKTIGNRAMKKLEQ